MKFGITFLGKHAIIKMNAKLTSQERKLLREKFEELNIYEIGANLTRIEGCMDKDTYSDEFRFDYRLAIQRSKIVYMEKHLEDMQKEKTTWNLSIDEL